MYSFVLPFHMILDVPVMQPCWSSSTVQSLSISFIYDSINLVNVPSELITTGTMVHFFSFHGPTTSHSNFSVNNSFLTFPFPQSWFQTGKKSKWLWHPGYLVYLYYGCFLFQSPHGSPSAIRRPGEGTEITSQMSNGPESHIGEEQSMEKCLFNLQADIQI